ncbi:2-keto-4-pentenoate hydratase [Pseudochelatococcus sp. G4_1912]|uniref:2-keto-4-pentenoate hydratase n=1 Tax=Pseudochelatococcus sp. G4_1912 TaxID=3114288 RepID=UPI0039C64679
MKNQDLHHIVSDRLSIEQAARDIYDAYIKHETCEPIRRHLAARDIAGAYAVQEANTVRWLSEGRRLTGRKIGLTAKIVQKNAGIDQPDYGMLFSDMEIADGDTIPEGTLFQPKAEGEIAFVLERDLTTENPSLAEVVRATAYALPALEIIDTRIANWDLDIVDTIADNASSGLYVLGATPRKIDQLDLQMCGMVIEKNGDPVSFGAGIACLGHPLNSLRWLARTMVRLGRPLHAGDVVMSGALGPMVRSFDGEYLEARISGLGSVGVQFGARKH